MKKIIVFGAAALVVIAIVLGLLFVLPSYLTKRGLDQLAAGLPAGTTFTYSGTSYALFANRVTLKNAALHIDQPELTLGIGEVIVTGGNSGLDKAIKAAEAAPNIDDTSETKIADRIEFKGIHVKQGMIDSTTGDFVIDNLRLSLPALYAPLPPLQPAALTIDTPALPNLAHTLQRGALYALASASDSATVTDFSVDVTQGAQDAKIGVKSIRVGADEHGDIQQDEIDGFTINAGLFGLSIDSAGAGHVDHRGMWTALRDGKALADVGNQPPTGGFTISGVKITNGGQQVLSIDEIKAGDTAYQNGVTTALDLTMSGLHVDPSRLPARGLAETVKGLGYTAPTFNGALSYHWDVAQKQIVVSNTNLTLDQGGSLSLNALIVDADPAAKPVGKSAKLANLSLRYDDAGLVSKFLALTAARTGRDLATVKNNYVATLEQQKANFTGDPAVGATIGAIEQFVENPKSITFSLNPPTPVGMDDFDKNQPQTFGTKLGLSAKAE